MSRYKVFKPDGGWYTIEADFFRTTEWAPSLDLHLSGDEPGVRTGIAVLRFYTEETEEKREELVAAFAEGQWNHVRKDSP